ncbi:hypothetical protein SERLA73DRAFT_161871 [Serpula lacrymans var. lacrymans S7.3]|uniref:Uncharacterized protein n=2 Tax=Serpula lacrymans var. lacrymans TaxID=341189 RepID=F8Q471_SERL3|nr:uncharacterized protein SERLADRAFT_416958 [Serpula lacrymans var. lacrymans S7.9]EGN96927.1 hypothetical protein SERLA73DRAFT_161871 [Serpula lacrymans var. lacrymans S7.3]EGO22520.1 hypothetical protein SERLADRAFT_416958 [Serpula lacrymans var. lacrymans S7.9]
MSTFPYPFDPKHRMGLKDYHMTKDFDYFYDLPESLFPAKAPYNRPPMFHFGYPADLAKVEKWAREHGFTNDMIKAIVGEDDVTVEDFQRMVRLATVRFTCREATKIAGFPVKITYGRRKGAAFWLVSLFTNILPRESQTVPLVVMEISEKLAGGPPNWYLDATRFYWNWLNI